MNIRYIVFFIICIFFEMNGYAQSNDKYVQKIRSYVNLISSMDAPQEGKAYFFDYTITSRARSQDPLNDKPVHTQIYIGYNLSYVKNQNLEVYKDDDDAFIVIHSNKSVIWSKGEPVENDLQKVNSITHLRDTLFDVSSVVSCQKVNYEKRKNVIRLVLKLNETGKEFYQIDKMAYWYDIDKEVVFKMKSEFTAMVDFEYMEYCINKIDLNYRKKILPPVRKLVVNEFGKLLPRFAGYKLMKN